MPNLSKIFNDNIPVLSFGFIKELYSIVQATANSNDALRWLKLLHWNVFFFGKSFQVNITKDCIHYLRY